jgi:beta-glucosidase
VSFQEDFVWGVATASYQIEGAAFEDGRGMSVWDMLCRKPGAVWSGHTGDVACDHYHRYPEDVQLMKALGVGAYRLSIAWPRIMPEGIGPINEKGLGFYDRLIDELLANGIDPWVTLFHWDFPLPLYHRGGWMNPDSPKWFADYAAVVVDRLSDRVSNWFTLNEPQCFVGLGLNDGIHAPGDKLRWAEVLLAGHHSNIAHGLATQVIRARSKQTPRVGFAPVGSVYVPASDKPEDIEAARTSMFAVNKADQWQNTWWMDPVFFGTYPEDGLKLYGDAAPKFTSAEMETIAQPMDFFGANIYHGSPVEMGPDGKPKFVDRPIGYPQTAFRWPVQPDCLYWGPKFFYERYGQPIVITENGCSSADWVALDGRCHDGQRVDFLHRHLRELKNASAEVPVEGYFQWSLLDNFEWAEGYKERFGIVHVDYPTQKRTPKDSYYFLQETIRANGANL